MNRPKAQIFHPFDLVQKVRTEAVKKTHKMLSEEYKIHVQTLRGWLHRDPSKRTRRES